LLHRLDLGTEKAETIE